MFEIRRSLGVWKDDVIKIILGKVCSHMIFIIIYGRHHIAADRMAALPASAKFVCAIFLAVRSLFWRRRRHHRSGDSEIRC